MKLLISAADAKEAFEAALGGADIVDAKDPAAGALGSVSLDRFVRMREVVPPHVPLSAALGDALPAQVAELMAAAFAQAGAAFVKVGVPAEAGGVGASLEPVVRGAGAAKGQSCGVVAAVFADRLLAAGASLDAVAREARDAGAEGLLIDTADKRGPRLTALVPFETLSEWVRSARRAGLFTAIAGGLALEDFVQIRDIGVDIIGVRGAACVGGRLGRVAREHVTKLRIACAGPAAIGAVPVNPAGPAS